MTARELTAILEPLLAQLPPGDIACPTMTMDLWLAIAELEPFKSRPDWAKLHQMISESHFYRSREIPGPVLREIYQQLKLDTGQVESIQVTDLQIAAGDGARYATSRPNAGTSQHIVESASMLVSNSIRDHVFISYSHRDEKWLNKLQKHLKPMIRNGLKVWDDTKIVAGTQWKIEISLALQRAKVAVLLVTPDFLDSEFIAHDELPCLLEAQGEGLSILWIAVKDSAYHETALNHYQALNDPGKPLSRTHHAHVDRELVRMCGDIKLRL